MASIFSSGAAFRLSSNAAPSLWKLVLNFRKFFSPLLKMPNPVASKLVITSQNPRQRSTHVHSARTLIFYSINSNPLRAVLHRLSHHFFPCISHVVVPEVELGQNRVDLQRLRDRLGTLGPDSVLFEADSVLFEAQGLVRSLLKSLIR